MAIDVNDLLSYAEAQLGKDYVFGTAGPETFDCSGLVKYVFSKFGVGLPHHAADQATMGTSVAKTAIAPGDLVFSDWGDGPNSHVGIAVTPKKVIDAPHTGAQVRYDDLSAGYLDHVTAVRRVTSLTGTAPATPGITTAVAGGSLFGPLGDLAAAVGDIAGMGERVMKLALPGNFTRLMSGTGGVILILLGIWFFSREVRA